jgi:phosphoglycolate phosphatase
LANAVNHALTTVGKPTKLDAEIISYVGNGLDRLISDVVGPAPQEIWDKAIQAFSAHYEHHYADKTTMYDGVLDGLREMSKHAKLGVVSNKPEHFSKLLLKALKVDSLFSVIIGGDSTPQTKPHPAPILKAMEQMSASGAVLMVGDGPQDIKAGQAAGIKTCAALYGYGFSSETSRLKPDYTIKRFSELKEIVS